jgi:hypothetical protein
MVEDGDEGGGRIIDWILRSYRQHLFQLQSIFIPVMSSCTVQRTAPTYPLLSQATLLT